MTELRLVPDDPQPVEPEEDLDDGTLGGLFAAMQAEILRLLTLGRGAATEMALGGVLLHLAALEEDYRGVPMPPPAERT